MVVTNTPVSDAPGVTTTPSVSEVIRSVNQSLRDAGGPYKTYSCKTVMWDDVTRGTIGGSLSSWGANITDTRLYAKDGQQLYTVRSDNFNEKLGAVTADELALIAGNNQPGGGALTPVTLRDVLKNFGKHASYAGVDKTADMSAPEADTKVSIRFQTTFLPVQDEEFAALEFAPEMYQYQTRSASDPANLLLLATTQGFAVQSNGGGATKMFHHAVEPDGNIARYWFEAERTTKKVGGAQLETKEEALAAASRGKATASVIGTRAMGTRFNVLMTIQVPLEQKPQEKRGGAKKKGMGLLFGCGGGGSENESMMMDMMDSACFEEDDVTCDEEDEGSAPPGSRPRVGTANAARVSRGSMVDRVDKTVEVKKPKRDPGQHITVTVVIYNTVAGGVPSAEDVKAAVEDMEQLYMSCGWMGELADEGADFMKKELTVKNAVDIADKLASQPYKPPAGAIGLVVGGDVFPTSA